MQVETGDPIELIRRLKAEDTGMDIYLCGGGKASRPVWAVIVAARGGTIARGRA
ncbi:hypothetical protein ABZ897_46365 [Nonomuraea sp. NPDC046802]|uniref:hypothetical protein n=1 Tax=Nonomuraea sp. NPDC046802 TaxID=3154919 RepID=UPI0033FEC3B8